MPRGPPSSSPTMPRGSVALLLLTRSPGKRQEEISKQHGDLVGSQLTCLVMPPCFLQPCLALSRPASCLMACLWGVSFISGCSNYIAIYKCSQMHVPWVVFPQNGKAILYLEYRWWGYANLVRSVGYSSEQEMSIPVWNIGTQREQKHVWLFFLLLACLLTFRDIWRCMRSSPTTLSVGSQFAATSQLKGMYLPTTHFPLCQ